MKQEEKNIQNEKLNINEIIQKEDKNMINIDQEKAYLEGEHHIDNSLPDTIKKPKRSKTEGQSMTHKCLLNEEILEKIDEKILNSECKNKNKKKIKLILIINLRLYFFLQNIMLI